MLFENVITCKLCGQPAIYEGCADHIEKYPAIINSKVFVPDCAKCKIVCHECGNQYTTNDKTIEKEPEVKLTLEDRIKNGDFNSRELVYYRQAITGILDLIFALDIGSDLAITDIKEKLPDIPIPDNTIKKSVERMSEILFTKLLCNAVGLGVYADEIVHAEINKIYKNKGD